METVRQIADRACDAMGIKYADLMDDALIRRRGTERDALQLVYWLAHKGGHTMSHIARELLRLDHTGIKWGIRQHEARMEREPLLRELSMALLYAEKRGNERARSLSDAVYRVFGVTLGQEAVEHAMLSSPSARLDLALLVLPEGLRIKRLRSHEK